MGHSHSAGRYKVSNWPLGLLLWLQFCAVVLAAQKSMTHGLSIGRTVFCEYGAFRKAVRFVPSADQKRSCSKLGGKSTTGSAAALWYQGVCLSNEYFFHLILRSYSESNLLFTSFWFWQIKISWSACAKEQPSFSLV